MRKFSTLRRKGASGKPVFATEADLVRSILVNGNRYPQGRAHLMPNVLGEFESSAGRADIVYFFLRPNWRQYSLYSQLPARWIYALRVLPIRKEFTAYDFAFLTGVSKQTAARILAQYEQFDFCKRISQRKHWVKVRHPIPIVKRIIAVEAKLTDWKRAISQACRYQRFANQTWVILDASRAKGAISARDHFQRLNVGLKVITPLGIVRTYVRPRIRMPKSPFHFWEANGLIAASINRTRRA
jgi:hypothetical protein